jgi:preprotein translocase subunit SecD
MNPNFNPKANFNGNRFPLWKYILLAVVILLGSLYAMPNLYGEDPSVQVSPVKGLKLDASVEQQASQLLAQAQIPVKAVRFDAGQLLVRLNSGEDQLKAQEVLKQGLGRGHLVALNMASASPAWLTDMGAYPMYLGLDLRGGVHFLMEVDMPAAVAKAYERIKEDVRRQMRDAKLPYLLAAVEGDQVVVKMRQDADGEETRAFILKNFEELQSVDSTPQELKFTLKPQAIKDIQAFALQQNITTLRNRVNELGVAEPVIQQQGVDRIVVQLPGVQDTVRAKEILGATATLEYRLVDETADVQAATRGRVPPGSKLYFTRQGEPIVLKKQVIVTGESVINAQSGIDSQNGSPMVSVTLDGAGGRKMLDTTKRNVGKRMAVVFIENRTETNYVDGQAVKKVIRTEDVINAAVIRDQFADRFQTTGLDSSDEARDLALLLRAGALAAPMDIVEERTVGPSLGQDNINQGFLSVVVGFLLVLLVMGFRYKLFGMIANAALLLNLVLIVALLSMLQATLTLPGIAGIVLTVGMAVDANVLIFERIREELKNGTPTQMAIHAGYERAFITIADANITTLIAAIVLFSFGSGPVKGFAITLTLGILTSMFTAILGTRAVVNAIYGNKRVNNLSI